MYVEEVGLMAEVSIELPGFSASFNKNVQAEVRQIVKRGIGTVVTNITRRLGLVVGAAIRESREYESLLAGTLRAEFGLPDPSAIDAVINEWIENIAVAYNSSGGQFGNLTIGIIDSDYSDVLTLPEASFSYSSRRGSGVLDWLRWLLLEGTNAIVRDYDFTSTTTRGSRTGLGIMVSRQGNAWTVPSEFSGTAGDNFVLRSLQSIDEEINNIVRQEITVGLK